MATSTLSQATTQISLRRNFFEQMGATEKNPTVLKNLRVLLEKTNPTLLMEEDLTRDLIARMEKKGFIYKSELGTVFTPLLIAVLKVEFVPLIGIARVSVLGAGLHHLRSKLDRRGNYTLELIEDRPLYVNQCSHDNVVYISTDGQSFTDPKEMELREGRIRGLVEDCPKCDTKDPQCSECHGSGIIRIAPPRKWLELR